MLQVKEGQVEKMALLFERYHRALYGFLYHLTGEPELSEDLVQNVFYRMLKYRHTFSGEGEFRTWMYHLARNALADAVKKTRPAAHHVDVTTVAERLGGGAAADEPLQRKQELEQLHRALERLSTESREVLVLTRFQELPYALVAQVLGTTEGAVKVRVHRALGQLKEIYRKLENGSRIHEL